MASKIRCMMLSEKIPAAVCLAACVASVLLGFAVGYMFFMDQDAYIYAEAADPYLAEITEPIPTYIEPQPTMEAMPVIPTIDKETHLYIVTVQDGYIVIFHALSYGGGLKEMTTTPVGMLAPEELERLAQGIKIYSDEDLTRLMQDYGS